MPASTREQPAGADRGLLAAVLAVASDLDLPAVLRRIVEAARDLAEAQYAALGVIGEDQHLVEFHHVGMDPQTVARIGRLPEGHGILGLLVVDPQPIRLADLTRHPQSAGVPPAHPPMHTFLGVPVRVRDRVFGNLYLAEKRGGGEFTQSDEDLVVALAGAAGVAIENARLNAQLQDVAVVEDRERIARDLHDKVIQRLFATGMSLQAVERFLTDPEALRRVRSAVDELDETVREIRGTIFALQRPVRRGVRSAVLALAAEAAPVLGFQPQVHFDGPVDSAVPDHLADDLLATVRELLANAARHANARSVDVVVAAGGAATVLRVLDDGCGMGHAGDASRAGGLGLRNVAERASAHGGAFSVTSRPDGGTVAVWQVPNG